MKYSGKTLLKVISVIFILFGIISVIVSLIALINIAGLGTGWVVATIIVLVSSLIELVIGILGYKKSGDSGEARFFIITGFVLGIILLISLVLSFSVLTLIGFALPVLYIVGGYMLRNAEI